MRTIVKLIFVTLALLLGVFIGQPVGANGSEPTYGTAVVDGDISEWDLNEDFFAEMHRAGDPEKALESRLYLRYNCATDTLFGLVKAEPGVPIEVDGAEEHWVKVDSNLVLDDQTGDDETPPDFAWVGLNESGTTAEGWEFSISLSDGTYQLVVHTLSYDEEVQTSTTEALGLSINCGSTAVELSSFTTQSDEPEEDLAPPWQVLLFGLGFGGIVAFVARKYPGSPQ